MQKAPSSLRRGLLVAVIWPASERATSRSGIWNRTVDLDWPSPRYPTFAEYSASVTGSIQSA